MGKIGLMLFILYYKEIVKVREKSLIIYSPINDILYRYSNFNYSQIKNM